MKRLCYPPSLAAAVEAVASTGGQIMPPLMGAGAFVMAELLARPYTDIVVAATLPALLFFAAVWIGVDRQARRAGLAPMPASERPDAAARSEEQTYELQSLMRISYAVFCSTKKKNRN